MRYLKLGEVLYLHQQILTQSGGGTGIRDMGALESALAQPQITFDGADLYPTLVEKAAALGFFLISNHPFVDGNKRIGQAAMELFLILNGREIEAEVSDQEALILGIASGQLQRNDIVAWLTLHVRDFNLSNH